MSDAHQKSLSIILAEITRRTVVRRVHQTECILSATSGQFCRDIGIDDRTCVDDIHSTLKYVDPLEEEWALLREENGKSKIRRADRSVGFDLSEIWIVCKVERDRRRDTELGRESELARQSTNGDGKGAGAPVGASASPRGGATEPTA